MAKTRKISEAQAIHIRDLMRAKLTEKYGPKKEDGSRSVGQRQICEEIDLTQPVLKDVEDGTGSIGVHALVSIRNFVEKSIDDLLMLDPLPKKKQPDESPPSRAELHSIMRQAVEEGLRRIDAPREPPVEEEPPPIPKKGKSDAPRPSRRR